MIIKRNVIKIRFNYLNLIDKSVANTETLSAKFVNYNIILNVTQMIN